jgi:ketosteroid isomerase-like protein
MKPIVLIVVSVIMAATVSAQSDSQKARISAEIRNVMSDQIAAWNLGDIEGFMRGYWRSDNLVFVSGANVTRGWQPTLDRYKKSYDTREKMGKLRFSDLEITVLSKDAAIVLGSWELTRENDNPKGKFTLVFRRLKEGWRIVMDHTS